MDLKFIDLSFVLQERKDNTPSGTAAIVLPFPLLFPAKKPSERGCSLMHLVGAILCCLATIGMGIER